MTPYAQKTQNDLIKLQFALPADEWIIQLVPEDGIGRPIRDIILRRKLYSMEQVDWFRARNANECHIYGRPNCTRFILVDDVTDDALSRMKQEGSTPTVVIETSPDNFQVWITASCKELPNQVSTELGTLLASKYGGDPGSTDALHLGRLPGLRNKKPKYQTDPDDGGPLVILRTARTIPIIPDAINELLEKARCLAEQRTPASSSAPGACVPADKLDIDPSRSPMTPIEAYEIYEAELKYQIARSDGRITGEDRSKADNAVAYGLRKRYRYEPDDLAALLVFASDKAQERGFKYVERTVRAACSSR